MAAPIVWQGPSTLQQIDDDWKIDPEKTTVVVTFAGPRADVRSNVPNLYQALAGFPGLITNVEIPGCQTPDGVIKITCVSTATQYVYELEWGTAYKKLLTLPIFQPGGNYALNDADLDLINQWANEATASGRSSDYANLAIGVAPNVSGNGQYYVNKLKLGEEEYPVPYPIARRITKTAQAPEDVGENMYVIDTPPDETGAPTGGWTYFKSADTCTKEMECYTRREEWTGAQYLDTDIFPD